MKRLLIGLITVFSFVLVQARDIPATSFVSNETVASTPIKYKAGKFYQGEEYLSRKEYRYLLQNTCPAAFQQYKRSNALIISGWTLFGAGVGLAALGGYLYIADYIGQQKAEAAGETYLPLASLLVGTVFLVSSTPLLASSIPLLGVGYSQRKKSVNTFNNSCISQEPPITYHLTAGTNGLGFAIRF